MQEDITTKVCSKCKLTLPLDRFWRDKSTKDGYCRRCTVCRMLPPEHRPPPYDPISNTKICSKCRRALPPDQFWPNKNRADGLNGYCKGCMVARRHELHPPIGRAHLRKPREQLKRVRGRAQYSITNGEYDALFAKQNGTCAICGVPSSQHKRSLHVDHNHKTGRIRGLLCVRCNMAIGCADDSIERLQKMIAYLEANDG